MIECGNKPWSGTARWFLCPMHIDVKDGFPLLFDSKVIKNVLLLFLSIQSCVYCYASFYCLSNFLGLKVSSPFKSQRWTLVYHVGLNDCPWLIKNSKTVLTNNNIQFNFNND